jgi:hypothetical protein
MLYDRVGELRGQVTGSRIAGKTDIKAAKSRSNPLSD